MMTEEEVEAGGRRARELWEALHGAVAEHCKKYEALGSDHLETDTFTAVAHLFQHVIIASGRPPIGVLAMLAEQLGVQTITANTKSVGRA